jgi:hypothetical protein
LSPTPCPTTPRNLVCNAFDSEELICRKHHFPCLPCVSQPAPTQSSPLYTMHSTRLCWASTGSEKDSACSALAFEKENFPAAMVPMLRSQVNAITILTNNQGTNAAFEYVSHGCAETPWLWCNATPSVLRVRMVWTRNKKQQPSCCMSSGSHDMQESNICCHSPIRSILFQI